MAPTNPAQQAATAAPAFDADLIRRYDGAGPRYTSYPTADRFHDGFTAADYVEALAQRNAERAKYPQAADAMRRLAEQETRHAEQLRHHLHVLGGDLPTVEPLAVVGNSQWERIVAAYEVAQGKRRRLIELFTAAVGLTPKRFGRIRRFQRATAFARTATVDWGRVAHHCGYYDQAHLIRDCHELAGMTPTELARASVHVEEQHQLAIVAHDQQSS